MILSCLPTFARLHAQEVQIDYWVWAGQSPADVSASETRILDLCRQQGYACQSSQKRILVRSWAGKDASLSTKHTMPRLFAKGSPVILSYRLEHLVDDREVGAIIRRDINIWQRAKRPVMMIEIDYDSPSFDLERYRQWLLSLKAHLNDDTSLGITGLGGTGLSTTPLSITGLPTWFEDNNRQARQLTQSVREVSLMFYRQEQTPITQHLLAALRKVDNLRYAFLCDDDRWQALVRETKKNETFRMAIFLLSRCIDVGEPEPS